MKELFYPIRNRPILPVNADVSPERWRTALHYREIAWIMYWHWVEREARKHACGLMEARQIVFRQGTVCRKNDWVAHDCLCEFMMQFEGWQMQPYNVGRMLGRDNRRGIGYRFNKHAVIQIVAKKGIRPDLEQLLSMLNYCDRGELVSFLMSAEMWDEIDNLTNDPIYGKEAGFELNSKKWKDEYEASEKVRKGAFHPNILAIDKMISRMGPSNYNVLFPYPINEFHDVPNCLCIMADGSPIFRLQVLDPEHCTQFELAELMPPWWGGTKLFQRPGPGEGQYDFPFFDFDITPGDQFDYHTLIKVIEKGVEQVNTRRRLGER